MRISFDFDGTLTRHIIRGLYRELFWVSDVYVITNRDYHQDNIDMEECLKQIGINIKGSDRVRFCNHEGKLKAIQDLDINIHFDDDPFEIEEIEKYSKCKCVLVDMSMFKTDKTDAGIIIGKVENGTNI